MTGWDPSGEYTVAEQTSVQVNVGTLSKISIPRAVSVKGRALKRIGCALAQKAGSGPVHHIFTNKNTKRGAKYTQYFLDVFDLAGLDLNGWYNQIQVPGHKGPHSKYNQEVKRMLARAIRGKKPGSPEYRDAIYEVIEKITQSVCNPKGKLYKLIT